MMPLPAESGQLNEHAAVEPDPVVREIREAEEETDGGCGYGPRCCF